MPTTSTLLPRSQQIPSPSTQQHQSQTTPLPYPTQTPSSMQTSKWSHTVIIHPFIGTVPTDIPLDIIDIISDLIDNIVQQTNLYVRQISTTYAGWNKFSVTIGETLTSCNTIPPPTPT